MKSNFPNQIKNHFQYSNVWWALYEWLTGKRISKATVLILKERGVFRIMFMFCDRTFVAMMMQIDFGNELYRTWWTRRTASRLIAWEIQSPCDS
jgi:hypothetical protein